MSVQKDRLIRKSNFTTITNNVIDGLQHDLRLLGLYIYLYKKPEIWDFHKNVIQRDCCIGEKLLNRLLRDLENMGLIEIKQMRNISGQFIHNDIHILDGNSFKINPYVKSRRTVAAGRQSRAIKKDDKKNNNKINTTKDKKLSTGKPSKLMKTESVKISTPLKNVFNENTSRNNNYEHFMNKPSRPQPIEWGPGHATYDSIHKKEVG